MWGNPEAYTMLFNSHFQPYLRGPLGAVTNKRRYRLKGPRAAMHDIHTDIRLTGDWASRDTVHQAGTLF